MLDQMMDRVLERAGEQLFREINSQEARIGIDVLVACHVQSSTRNETIALLGTFLQDSHKAFSTASLGDIPISISEMLAKPEFDATIIYRSSEDHEGSVRVRKYRKGENLVLVLTDIPVPPHKPSICNNILEVLKVAAAAAEVDLRSAQLVEHNDERSKPLGQRAPRRGGDEDFELISPTFTSDGKLDQGREPRSSEIAKSEVERLIGGTLP